MHRLATVHARDNQRRHDTAYLNKRLFYKSKVRCLIITKTMFMVLSSLQSHCESSPSSSDDCRMVPSGRRPKTKPNDLGCESACTGCQKLHPPLPFIIITQPESWYSFYRPTEGRRLSQPSWLVTYRDGLPVQTVTHPGKNWRSATMLIEANMLPLSQTANWFYYTKGERNDADE